LVEGKLGLLKYRSLIICLCVVLLESCGPGENASDTEVIRLIELIDRAETESPDMDPSSWPKGITPASVATGRGVARLLMNGPKTASRSSQRQYGDDSRLVLLAPTDSRYRFEIDLTVDPVLDLGLGYVPPENDGSRVRYRVSVDDGNGASVVLDEWLEMSPEGDWQNRTVSLEDWSERSVTLELATETDDASSVWAAWSSPEIRSQSAREKGWNVVLILLDTLRADHLGSYGHGRPTSPNLDALARRSVRFAEVVTQSPWTRPSHRALFSGLYPASTQGLHSPPLAALLWERGYRTLALTGGGYVHSKFGFDAGFDSYRVHDWLNDLSSVTRNIDTARRQFLFLHTYEIHDPLTHDGLAKGLPGGRVRPGFSGRIWRDLRPLTQEEIDYVKALYDSGVAFTDGQLGRLFEGFEAAGVFDSSIVIVTSDHGEELWEHGGFRHGKKLYDHQLLVPLIVWLPAALREEIGGIERGRVIEDQVRLVDLYPTVVDLLGLPLQHEVQGRSLRPLLEGETLPEVDAYTEATITTVQLLSLRSKRYKFIQTVDGENPQVYDLQRDPAEKQNLSASSAEFVALLRRRVRAIRSGERRPEDVVDPEDMDPELREQLRALGYIK
jgi:arylsulfatase A-like enzyme